MFIYIIPTPTVHRTVFPLTKHFRYYINIIIKIADGSGYCAELMQCKQKSPMDRKSSNCSGSGRFH